MKVLYNNKVRKIVQKIKNKDNNVKKILFKELRMSIMIQKVKNCLKNSIEK